MSRLILETYIKGISVGINEETGRLSLQAIHRIQKRKDIRRYNIYPETPDAVEHDGGSPADIKLATEPSRQSSDSSLRQGELQ